jgi:peptide/nickel transport system substrate-binding protein
MIMKCGTKIILFSLITGLFVSLMVLASSCQSAPSSIGGTVTVGEIADGLSIGYPAKLMRVSSSRIAAPVIENLFRFDKEGKLIPWLVKEYKEDNKANTITLTLNKGIKFQDGSDFNAAVVKWNLDQCTSAKLPGSEKFKSIEVVDDYTVRINLTQWDSTVISNLAQTLGMMISKASFDKNGVDWAASNPVGTGPYQFVSWVKDSKVTFKKSTGYWQNNKPYLDSLVFVPVVDSLTRQMSFKAGELDLMFTNDAKSIKDLEKAGYIVTRRSAGSGATSLVPDSANSNSPFANLKVRQALSYAIDRDQINKAVFSGENQPVNQMIYKAHWGYNSDIKGYPYDPAKAKQLLAEAGYANGIKTKILFIGVPDFKDCFTAVQGYLKTVGIDAELDGAEIGRFQNTVWGGGKWEGLAMGPSTTNPDLTAMLFTRCAGKGPFYTQMWIPDDYGAAIQNAVNAGDFASKQKYTQEAMKLMIDKYALQSPIYCMTDFSVSQKYVHNHGIGISPNGAQWTPEEISRDK